MSKEYIEREALKNNLHCTKQGLFFCGGKTYIDFDVVSKAVLETPAADVAEVRHGHWYDIIQCEDVAFATCSVCGIRGKVRTNRSEWGIWYVDSSYCPKCGANMDGGNKI